MAKKGDFWPGNPFQRAQLSDEFYNWLEILMFSGLNHPE